MVNPDLAARILKLANDPHDPREKVIFIQDKIPHLSFDDAGSCIHPWKMNTNNNDVIDCSTPNDEEISLKKKEHSSTYKSSC